MYKLFIIYLNVILFYMNLIRLLLLLLLILIIFFLYYGVNKELYTGYKKGGVDNIYNNIKKINKKKDIKKYSKILKLNNINIELPTDNYTINKNNNNTHIKSYIDNKVDDSKLVKKKNIRDDISHLYKRYKDDHHNKSGYFFK